MKLTIKESKIKNCLAWLVITILSVYGIYELITYLVNAGV